MESPAIVVFIAVHINGQAAFQIVPLLFVAMWQGHCLNRTLLFPFRIRASGRKMPLLIVGSGCFFNAIDAYTNARFIPEFREYGIAWLTDPRFLIGVGIFLAGIAPDSHSDKVNRAHRRCAAQDLHKRELVQCDLAPVGKPAGDDFQQLL